MTRGGERSLKQVIEEEKYNLKAANRCRSISYLTKLLEKFKEIQYEDNETR